MLANLLISWSKSTLKTFLLSKKKQILTLSCSMHGCWVWPSKLLPSLLLQGFSNWHSPHMPHFILHTPSPPPVYTIILAEAIWFRCLPCATPSHMPADGSTIPGSSPRLIRFWWVINASWHFRHGRTCFKQVLWMSLKGVRWEFFIQWVWISGGYTGWWWGCVGFLIYLQK